MTSKSGSYISCDPPRSGVPFPCASDAFALGAADTSVSLGRDGRIYGQNNGHLFMIGFPVEVRAVPIRPPGPARSPSIVPRA